jgi:hypothetical protein
MVGVSTVYAERPGGAKPNAGPTDGFNPAVTETLED